MVKRLTILILSTLFFVAISSAQQKIAFIDSNRVLQESIGGQEVLKQLNDAKTIKQNEYNAKLKVITDLRNKYQAQRFALSSDALQKLLTDIEQKETALKRFQEDAEKELANLQARLFAKLQNEVNPIIDKLGAEGNYTLILDLTTPGIIYYDRKADITEELIKRYNQTKATPAPTQQKK
ncbi:MAG: OmpH family outer membrane protein [Candidatus Aminicenantia bacterium]